MSGDNNSLAVGVYGTQGQPDVNNVPGARRDSWMHCDAAGDLWVFGGLLATQDDSGVMNDLWRWDGASWAWFRGSQTAENSDSSYGSVGVSSNSNEPGGRYSTASDTSDGRQIYMFGGIGNAQNSQGLLTDVWQLELVLPTPTPMPTTTATTTVPLTQVSVVDVTTIITGTASVRIVDTNGEEILQIFADNGVIDGELVVQQSSNDVDTTGVVSALVDISLEGGGQPNGDVTLCFWVPEVDADELELAHYDDDSSAECFKSDDDNLSVEDTRTRNGVEEILVCGEVDHFTDFGILLAGEADSCNTNEIGDLSLPFIISSSVLIGVAICCVVLIVFVVYKNRRVRKYAFGSEAVRVEKLRDVQRRRREEQERKEQRHGRRFSNELSDADIPSSEENVIEIRD